MTPDYKRFLDEVLSDGREGPQHAEALNQVASALISGEDMQRLTGGDFDAMNDAIDAQLDILIAASRGEIRFALFAALSGFASAMNALHGPRR